MQHNRDNIEFMQNDFLLRITLYYTIYQTCTVMPVTALFIYYKFVEVN